MMTTKKFTYPHLANEEDVTTGMTVEALRTQLRARGLPLSGRKPVLEQRLKDYFRYHPTTSEQRSRRLKQVAHFVKCTEPRDNDYSLIHLLLECGANIDDCFETIPYTPLKQAACYGNSKMVEYLIKCGASIDCYSQCVTTPLQEACRVYKNIKGDKEYMDAAAYESSLKDMVSTMQMLVNLGANIHLEATFSGLTTPSPVDIIREDAAILIKPYESRKKWMAGRGLLLLAYGTGLIDDVPTRPPRVKCIPILANDLVTKVLGNKDLLLSIIKFH